MINTAGATSWPIVSSCGCGVPCAKSAAQSGPFAPQGMLWSEAASLEYGPGFDASVFRERLIEGEGGIERARASIVLRPIRCKLGAGRGRCGLRWSNDGIRPMSPLGRRDATARACDPAQQKGPQIELTGDAS